MNPQYTFTKGSKMTRPLETYRENTIGASALWYDAQKKQGAQMQPKALASYLTNCNNNSTPKINRHTHRRRVCKRQFLERKSEQNSVILIIYIQKEMRWKFMHAHITIQMKFRDETWNRARKKQIYQKAVTEVKSLVETMMQRDASANANWQNRNARPPLVPGMPWRSFILTLWGLLAASVSGGASTGCTEGWLALITLQLLNYKLNFHRFKQISTALLEH